MSDTLICFDLDGTLLDSVPAIIDTLNELALERERPERFDQEFFRSHSLAQAFRHIGVPLFSVAGAIKKARPLYEKRLARVKPFPGVVDFLEDLKSSHVMLSVVTTNSSDAAEQVLERLDLRKYFLDVRGGSAFGKHKHIKLSAKSLGASRILYVGDETRDLIAGRRARAKTCGVTWGLQSEELLVRAKPTMIARTVDELSQLCDAFAKSLL